MSIRAVTALLLIATCTVHARQVRDAERAATTGRGEVAGVVVDQRGQPVRRVFVELSLDRRTWRQAAVTNVDGRFAFTDVPAGAYDLAATKPPFLAARFGATKPGGKGIPIVLADGARISGVELTLVPGAVIAGRISDERGEPSSNVSVRILRRSARANGTAFERVDSYANTDDRGEYRIFGLQPGEYLVTAAPLASSQPATIRLTTQADVDRALQDRRSSGAPVTNRNSLAAPASMPAPDATPRATIAIAPVYYPGTTNAALASVVTLAAGEERTRVDFQTEVVRTGRVEGRVTSLDGPLPGGMFVTMVPTAFTRTLATTPSTVAVRPDGTFSFPGVPPGDYMVAAGPGSQIVVTSEGASRAVSGGQAPPGAPSGAWSFGAAPVRVDGHDVTDVAVAIQRGLDVPGRVAFAGTSPSHTVQMSVVLTPAEEVSQIVRQPFAGQPDRATGQFVISGVTPGRYRVGVASPLVGGPVPPPTWTLKSIAVKGRDVTDLPFDIVRDAEPLDLVVTMSDRPASLQGRFQDAAARPVTEFFVVLFSTDRAFWTWQSRRVLAARPSSDGVFAFSNVPAGEYWLAAATGLDANEWFDAALLQQLTAGSIRVAIADGEKKIQDIALPK
jgi:hypothetical protein